MKTLKIGYTDIILDDKGQGQGKITISDPFNGAYTYYWGAMGESLEQFICSINEDYFASKLCRKQYKFSLRGTLRNLRQAIKEELPWYEEMEAQKTLRWEINHQLSGCSSAEEWVHACAQVPKSICITGYSYDQEKYFIERIEDIFTCEPWHFIDEEVTSEYKWLAYLHFKIKSQLNVAIAA